jgi:NAD-dependent DNA ligase
LRKHPRISSEHLDKIKDFEKLLKQHKENSFSETNPEVHNSIHDNVYSILDELEIINDELDKKGISK